MSAHGVVERPGPFCTIQDLGRRAGRRAGLAPGGAMDQRAYLWANRLLGNDPTAAALEITLGGFALRFAVETVLAITGTGCAAALDGVETGAWRTLRVRPGQLLRLGYGATGMRSYLALPGGLDVPTSFGSASAVVRDGLPGLLGRPLHPGQTLRWRAPDYHCPVRRVPDDLIPPPPDSLTLPLVAGYEWAEFSRANRDRVFDATWTIDPASDRTATRLAGPALTTGPRVLDSTPLVDGTVQVTGDGLPLVFMRDRPTIGGYAKLGSVDPIALDALAQARPGTPVRFARAEPDVLLPHTLELAPSPHALLREVDRVLRADGRVVVLSFNPNGLWGLRQVASPGGYPPGHRRPMLESRLGDWLKLLNFDIDKRTRYCHTLPLERARRFGTFPREEWARRWMPVLGGGYLLSAQKRVHPMTPIRPLWRRRRLNVVGGLVKPTTNSPHARACGH